MINETLWHDEKQVFNAVTGQQSNFPQGDGTIDVGTFPTKGTIPIAQVKTGTITTDSNNGDGRDVLGVGTKFIEEGLKVGDYLYDGDAAVRRIDSIASNTSLRLSQAFPSDLTADDVLYCERQVFKMIIVESTGSAAAELQESLFAVGRRVVHGGAPIAYDASMSDAQISVFVSQ